MIDELSQFAESLMWIGDQVLVADLDVIGGKQASGGASAAHHPLPVEGGSDQAVGFVSIPWQRVEALHFFKRQCNVAAVADDVHEQGIRNVPFYAPEVQHVIAVVESPTGGILMLSD